VENRDWRCLNRDAFQTHHFVPSKLAGFFLKDSFLMGYIINQIGQTKVFFSLAHLLFSLVFFFKDGKKSLLKQKTGVCHQSSEFSLRGAGKENRLLF